MVAHRVVPGSGHECNQLADEVEGREHHVGSTIPEGMFELILHLSVGTGGQTVAAALEYAGYTIASSSVQAVTTFATAVRSSPKPCAGCGLEDDGSGVSCQIGCTLTGNCEYPLINVERVRMGSPTSSTFE